MGLLDEAAPEEGPGEDKLREYGLGEEEIDFLIRQGRRIELNAMTSDQFVAWLEGKLAEHGAGKVVPEVEVLERHARRVLARRLAADRVRSLGSSGFSRRCRYLMSGCRLPASTLMTRRSGPSLDTRACSKRGLN